MNCGNRLIVALSVVNRNLYCNLSAALHLCHNVRVRWNSHDAHLTLLAESPMLIAACHNQKVQVQRLKLSLVSGCEPFAEPFADGIQRFPKLCLYCFWCRV